uniref:diphosphoinositol-polyphosphate diphosphatase n=1 Tax=Corvus moneduloides TaxID=1196302 RepID=A0A8C3EMQ1_CORMO
MVFSRKGRAGRFVYEEMQVSLEQLGVDGSFRISLQESPPWCCEDRLLPQVLLVSSSRYPDQWIVPGGGMEPEEEPGGAAVREVYEEAGVKGKLGRLLGIFENQDRKHRTYVYVLTVTEILEDWEDSVNIGRKREWFKVEDAIKVLQCHKPVHAEYLEKLKLSCSPTNGNSVVPPLPDNNSLYVTSAQTSGLPSTVR